jgi:hypothetical protein
VYVKEVLPANGGSLHRDYIVPVMQVRLDGRELFLATEDDQLMHRRKAMGTNSNK